MRESRTVPLEDVVVFHRRGCVDFVVANALIVIGLHSLLL